MEGGGEEVDEEMLRKTDQQEVESQTPLGRRDMHTQQMKVCQHRCSASLSQGFSLDVDQEQFELLELLSSKGKEKALIL